MPADVTLEDLSTAMAKAVADGLAAHKHETDQATSRAVIDDPLVKEAIEKATDERVAKALADAEDRWKLDRERELAEKNMVNPALAKRILDSEQPLSKAVIAKRPEACNEYELEVHKVADDLCILNAVIPTDSRAQAFRRYIAANGLEGTGLAKALDTYSSNQGVDFIPTAMSASFIQEIDEGGKIMPLFGRFAMSQKKVDMPGQSGRAQAYRTTAAENGTITATTYPATRKVSFDAETAKVRRDFSEEFDQDSVVDVMGWLRSSISADVAEWLDIMILDGDTQTTHQDNTVGAPIGATDPRKCWDGLRRKALADSHTKDLGTFNLDALLAMCTGLGKYANPDDCVWVVSNNTYWSKLFTLKDAAGNPAWLPANMPGVPSPVVTGQVGWLLGAPVVPTGLQRIDLNASGVYDGSTTDNSVINFFNRKAWMVGDRKDVTMETEKEITMGSFILVTSWRGDFQHLHGTDATTYLGYNVTV